jgi:hypothetical protein
MCKIRGWQLLIVGVLLVVACTKETNAGVDSIDWPMEAPEALEAEVMMITFDPAPVAATQGDVLITVETGHGLRLYNSPSSEELIELGNIPVEGPVGKLAAADGIAVFMEQVPVMLPWGETGEWAADRSHSRLHVVDIQDPENPVILNTFDIEGVIYHVGIHSGTIQVVAFRQSPLDERHLQFFHYGPDGETYQQLASEAVSVDELNVPQTQSAAFCTGLDIYSTGPNLLVRLSYYSDDEHFYRTINAHYSGAAQSMIVTHLEELDQSLFRSVHAMSDGFCTVGDDLKIWQTVPGPGVTLVTKMMFPPGYEFRASFYNSPVLRVLIPDIEGGPNGQWLAWDLSNNIEPTTLPSSVAPFDRAMVVNDATRMVAITPYGVYLYDTTDTHTLNFTPFSSQPQEITSEFNPLMATLSQDVLVFSEPIIYGGTGGSGDLFVASLDATGILPAVHFTANPQLCQPVVLEHRPLAVCPGAIHQAELALDGTVASQTAHSTSRVVLASVTLPSGERAELACHKDIHELSLDVVDSTKQNPVTPLGSAFLSQLTECPSDSESHSLDCDESLCFVRTLHNIAVVNVSDPAQVQVLDVKDLFELLDMQIYVSHGVRTQDGMVLANYEWNRAQGLGRVHITGVELSQTSISKSFQHTIENLDGMAPLFAHGDLVFTSVAKVISNNTFIDRAEISFVAVDTNDIHNPHHYPLVPIQGEVVGVTTAPHLFVTAESKIIQDPTTYQLHLHRWTAGSVKKLDTLELEGKQLADIIVTDTHAQLLLWDPASEQFSLQAVPLLPDSFGVPGPDLQLPEGVRGWIYNDLFFHNACLDLHPVAVPERMVITDVCSPAVYSLQVAPNGDLQIHDTYMSGQSPIYVKDTPDALAITAGSSGTIFIPW